MLINWKDCVSHESSYLVIRKIIFFIFFTPIGSSLFITFLFLIVIFATRISLSLGYKFVINALLVILMNLQFTDLTTSLLNKFLFSNLPIKIENVNNEGESLVVLLGRGQRIAKATTDMAISLYKSGKSNLFYISGDNKNTARLLIKGGIPPKNVYGDSCAKTTWENAEMTSKWIKYNYNKKEVILITDQWQLPRATLSFIKQGVTVQPLSVLPELNSKEKNFLAKRETLGTIMYRILGRI